MGYLHSANWQRRSNVDENEAELLDKLARCLEIQRELLEHYRSTLAWRRTLARSLHSGSPGPAQDLLSICRQTLLSD